MVNFGQPNFGKIYNVDSIHLLATKHFTWQYMFNL